MKKFLKKAYEIHDFIGKIFTFTCTTIFIAALIGLIIGTTKISKRDAVSETNYFINENVPVHNDNYIVCVNHVRNLDRTSVKTKEETYSDIKGYFINVNLTLSQISESKLKPHKIDKNDFKLKDHTGVYFPLNEIVGALGWNAIDMHIDNDDSGYVMSSTSFTTVKAYEDYNYIDYEINSGISIDFDLYFMMDKLIDIKKN